MTTMSKNGSISVNINGPYSSGIIGAGGVIPMGGGGGGLGGASAKTNVTPGTGDMNFEVQVVSVDSGYPHGVECAECRHTFVDGDVVLAGQKRLVGWIGWHTRCLKSILEDSPMDEYEITKQKLLNGEDPFE